MGGWSVFVYARRIYGWYAQGVKKEPMKSRVIRIPDALWEKARARADEKGETVSEAVRKFLERYTR